MDEVLKNAALFLDILRMSKTRMIQQWDAEAFQRAVKWARYFEQVYEKLKNRESLKQKISRHLQKISSADISTSGTLIMSFQDLKDAQKILKNNILQNSFCSADIFTEALKFFYNSSGSSATETLNEDLSKVLEVGQLCRTSKNIGMRLLKFEQERQDNRLRELRSHYGKTFCHENICEDKKLTEDHLEEVFNRRVKSRLLRKSISKDLQDNENITPLIHKLDSVSSPVKGEILLLEAYLQNIRDSQAALSDTFTTEDSEICREKVHNFSQQYIKGNLVTSWKRNLRRFLLLPASKLVEVALACDWFLTHYTDVLRLCCNEYDQEFGVEELCIFPCSKGDDVKRSKLRDSWQKEIEEHFKELNRADMINIVNSIDCRDKKVDESVSIGVGKLTESIWDQMVNQVVKTNEVSD